MMEQSDDEHLGGIEILKRELRYLRKDLNDLSPEDSEKIIQFGDFRGKTWDQARRNVVAGIKIIENALRHDYIPAEGGFVRDLRRWTFDDWSFVRYGMIQRLSGNLPGGEKNDDVYRKLEDLQMEQVSLLKGRSSEWHLVNSASNALERMARRVMGRNEYNHWARHFGLEEVYKYHE